jgi:hypothetical protein
MSINGIWPPYEAFYIESMLWHTASAERSIKVVRDWLELIRNDDERALELPRPVLFEQLQNILHQAACISRYFFPAGRAPKPLHVARAGRLRQAFGVDDDNPLAERDLRNAIEHFDERLDEYLTENHIGEFVPEDVGYLPRKSEVPLHIFKGFYTHPLIFVLLGQSYEMAPIVNEMLRINKALQGCTEDGHRLLRPTPSASPQSDG